MRKIIFGLTILGLSLGLNAESFVINDRAEVVSSRPIYRDVIKRVPYQECWDEQVPVREYYGSNNPANDNLGALIGGVAGGILGHQVGGGHGKTVATVGGAIIGTLVGKNLSGNRPQRGYSTTYKTVRKCVTKYTENSDRVITRYKNVAYYNGRKIVKFSDHPLKYIHIRKIIEY